MSNGFVNRLLRALRMDPTLYREVKAPGSSSRQAIVVVVLAAVGVGAAVAARDFLPVAWGIERYGSFEGEVLQAVYLVTVISISHVTAWPVWAGGLWFFGLRLGGGSAEAPEFGHVARAIAFAQTPGVLGVLVPVFVAFLWGVTDIESVTVGTLVARVYAVAGALRALISGWVLVGTFLAVRQMFGLSSGRTLGTIFAVGVASASLLAMVAIALILLFKVIATAFDLYSDWGDSDIWASPSLFAHGFGIPIAHGFEFNVGLRLSSTIMSFVLPLVPAVFP